MTKIIALTWAHQLRRRGGAGGEPVVIPDAEAARPTPSVVGITNSGERLSGQVAKRQAVAIGEHSLFHQAVHGPPRG